MSARIVLELTNPTTVSGPFTWEGGDGLLLADVSGSAEIKLQIQGGLGNWFDVDVCGSAPGSAQSFSLPRGVVVRVTSSDSGSTYSAQLIQDTRRTIHAGV